MVDVVTAILVCRTTKVQVTRACVKALKKPDELNKIGNKKQ